MNERATPTTTPPRRLGIAERVARFAVRHGSRRRAIAVLSGASVGDFFIPALPTQTSVIALGLMQPQRAGWVALAFAAAAAAGAGVLALALALVGGYAQQFGEAQVGADWAAITARVRELGVWAVLLASVFPTPPRLLTAATLLAGASAGSVMAAVFAGKLLWFGGFLALLVWAPAVLERVPVIGTAVRRFVACRQRVLAETPVHAPRAPSA